MYKRLTVLTKGLSQCIYFLIIFLLFISLNCSQSFPIDSAPSSQLSLVQNIPEKTTFLNYLHSINNFNGDKVIVKAGDAIPTTQRTDEIYDVTSAQHESSPNSNIPRELGAEARRHARIRHTRRRRAARTHRAAAAATNRIVFGTTYGAPRRHQVVPAAAAAASTEQHHELFWNRLVRWPPRVASAESAAALYDNAVPVEPVHGVGPGTDAVAALDLFGGRRQARATHHAKDSGGSGGVAPATGKRNHFCPGQDVATRAYLAPTVFEGKVRSMSSNKKPQYAVTFEVKVVYKNQARFKPLVKNETIRLHFAHGRGTNCDCLDNIASTGCGGLVKAHLRPGKTYILFVNRVGSHNYTVLGPPVASTNKSVHAVQRVVVHPNSVKPANVSELSDVTLKRGKKLKLVCRTQGFPPPRVLWFKNGTDNFLRLRRVRIQYRRRQSTLVISKVRPEDAGRYECTARGVTGPPVTKSAFVKVTNNTRTENLFVTASSADPHPCTEDRAQICMNGGTCMFFSSIGEYACQCANGFNGRRCDQKMPLMTKTEDKMLMYPPTRLIPGL